VILLESREITEQQ